MTDIAAPSEVVVVLDPNFGERLRELWKRQPIWIAMSPANAPVVQALRAAAPNTDYRSGITGFPHSDSRAAAERFLDMLSDIELHHGPYSTSTPYTRLKVIGAHLTPAIRAALCDLGFLRLRQDPNGFTATRTEDEAKRRREQ
jgi:hypothetical protein